MKQAAIRRGYLVNALYMAYPQPLSDRAVLLLMMELGYTSADFEKDIAYLQDKGYIEIEEKEFEIFPKVMRLLKLTPKGIDLVEKIIKDKGVVFTNGETK